MGIYVEFLVDNLHWLGVDTVRWAHNQHVTAVWEAVGVEGEGEWWLWWIVDELGDADLT